MLYNYFSNYNCKTKTKTIRNLQNILRKATILTLLEPYFGRGFMAVPSGSVVHVIQCTALDTVIDQSRDECKSQLPISLHNHEGNKINGTRYADANTWWGNSGIGAPFYHTSLQLCARKQW